MPIVLSPDKLAQTAYNGRMSEFWAGTLVGFLGGIVASLIATFLWELPARRRAYRAAAKIVGEWEAYNIEGRTVTTPMKGAGITEVYLQSRWWSPDSGVLGFHSVDIDSSTGRIRKHDGTIVLDPVNPWLATRIDRYADSNEISQQRLEIDPNDCNTVYIFPDPTVATLGDAYGKHAWRRKC